MKSSKKLQTLFLAVTIIFIWCWVYGRMSWAAWQTPLGYGGDGWLVLGYAKAFMDGDVFPVMSKWVAHLGAPFSANWNDYPLTEEAIFAMMGWAGRVVGIFPAANFSVLLAHLLAGLSFWFVGRELKYRAEFVFSGAILFAFSHYIFARNISHIVLSYYWHLPFILLVSWWAYSSDPILFTSRKWFVAIAVAIVSGVLNPYYAWMFLQFIGFSFLLHVARRQYQLVKFPLILILVTIVSFFIMNVDTLSYSWLHGENLEAVNRSLAGLEIYGLKIPELVFPPGNHSWRSWAEYGQRHYFVPAAIKGEMGSPYLGLVGLAGLALLAGISLYRFLQGRLQTIPVHAWQTLWVLLYSLIGGINLLLGTFGLILFRGSNRFSIVILAIVLLFLVRQLSRKCPEKLVLPTALLIMVLGLWDQLPPRVTTAQIQQMANGVQTDRSFANSLESQLIDGAMVFQLPVAAFPEIPPILQMGDYEHFRPYIFTQNLHYSYGTNKGRGDADWQIEVSKLAPANMADALEKYGFNAVMINRKGYDDRGARLLAEIVSANRPILADYGDLVAIKLNPAATRLTPKAPPVFGVGWSGDEVSHRWAISSRAEIKILNQSNEPRLATLEFSMSTLKPRIVKITMNEEILRNLPLLPIGNGTAASSFKLSQVKLAPGQNTLALETDVPAELPGTGDPRALSFQISGFRVVDDLDAVGMK